jgi:hypothetical protein
MPPFLWLRFLTGQRLLALHRYHLGAKKRDAGHEVALHHGALPQATSVSLAEILLGRLTSPTWAAQRAEVRARLQEALDALDPIDREILTLRHFEELSNAEAAQVLGLSSTAASSRYIRALGGCGRSWPASPACWTAEFPSRGIQISREKRSRRLTGRDPRCLMEGSQSTRDGWAETVAKAPLCGLTHGRVFFSRRVPARPGFLHTTGLEHGEPPCHRHTLAPGERTPPEISSPVRPVSEPASVQPASGTAAPTAARWPGGSRRRRHGSN